VKLLPVHVWASALASEALARGAKGVLMVGLRAKRLVELQLEDLSRASSIARSMGLESKLVLLGGLGEKPPRPPRGWVTAPLAVLPGRLSASACSAAPGRCLGPLMEYAGASIAAWIVDEALSEPGQLEPTQAT